MASEDTLEDLPGDQPVDSPVHTEQSDTESWVGKLWPQKALNMAALFFFCLSIHYYGPSLFCLPRSLPAKKDISSPTANHSLVLILVRCCDFAALCALTQASLQRSFVVKRQGLGCVVPNRIASQHKRFPSCRSRCVAASAFSSASNFSGLLQEITLSSLILLLARFEPQQIVLTISTLLKCIELLPRDWLTRYVR